MADTLTDKPYAICTEDGCGTEFDDREAASTHGSETMEAAKLANPDWIKEGRISGHGYRIINPTPEEKEKRARERMVSWPIEKAMDDAMEELCQLVDNGDMTKEQVTEELRWYPDFHDAWIEILENWDEYR